MINTWLPLPDFLSSAKSLSDEHLTTQRFQVLEIMEHLHSIEEDDSRLPGDYETHDLDGHPILDMWKGYELQLIEYGMTICEEWEFRHKKDDPIYKALSNHAEWATSEDASFFKPNWFGDVEFHLSHQAELLRRDPTHYKAHFVIDGENRKLVWPQSNHG